METIPVRLSYNDPLYSEAGTDSVAPSRLRVMRYFEGYSFVLRMLTDTQTGRWCSSMTLLPTQRSAVSE